MRTAAHPLLTTLPPAPQSDSELSETQKTQLRADASTCIAAIMSRRPSRRKAAAMEPAHVAAALALMCGYFRKGNGEPNPSAAAREFGHEISRPKHVTDKVTQLEELEAALQREEAGRAEMAAREAAGVVDDERTTAWRAQLLSAAMAQIWMEGCSERSIDDTLTALCSRGWILGGKLGQVRIFS